MRGIFISYRREDSEGQAGRLFDDLIAHFGRDAVFMDVADIRKGVDFRRVIDEHVTACGVLLVIIGKRWLSVTDSKGNRRLDDANDFVRLETAAALSRDIPVVPVLVQDADMPTEQDLPDAIKGLAFRNGTELTHARWDSDVKLLIEDLRPYVKAPVVAAPAPRPETARGPTDSRRSTSRSIGTVAATAMIVSVASIVGYHLWESPSPARDHAIEPRKFDPARVPAADSKTAAAKVADQRNATARKDADQRRKREQAERAAQLAEEQRKREEEARQIALAQAEKDRIAAEQAAAAKAVTDIATSVLGGLKNNRR